ncbi:MAG: anhydro-N-acetylmuramic acid kinase, partial [Amphiplicatus sp.]|nr:anhydro-N-acetylmuramic acid kinase [Amphiplicatus sp.]
MSDILTAIGLMSGTSLDGVDAAVLRTDGERVVEAGPALHFPYTPGVKASIQRAIRAALEGREGATEVGQAAVDVTDAHVAAVEGLIQRENLQRSSIDVIGFHGQTILHRPARSSGVQGRTWQIGDGAQLAAQ